MISTQRVEVGAGAQRPSVAPFQVRGRFFTAIVLQMARAPDAAFFAALDTMLAQTPHFFANAPFVLDLDQAAEIGPNFDFIGLARDMRNRKVTLIGVQNGTIEQNKAALHAGLITLPGGTDVLPETRSQAPAANGEATPKAEAKPAKAREHKVAPLREAPIAPLTGATLLVTEPVRSGQQIFAERGDLVVVASVSPGAELIAHGNIHVYGALRGRALAGVHGDNAARIFCQGLEAELIAIAGLYKLSDAIDPSLRRGRVQAFLDNGTLCVEPLK
ncbi:MAG TPA: septum site-determining protein MinC [Stellaceae bacterium]|jgi:septum site-determining protein MinC|nr:septum site-determining protein MinC [Stellaceae bacterium]